MARRSPMNKRYQKHGTPKGQTRKSAASAKPVRSASTGSSKPAEKKSFRERMAEGTPQTPEYKRNRRIWWIALMVGAAALGISLIFSLESVIDKLGTTATTASLVLTSISLVAIGYAWYIDLRKIRPELKKFQESPKGKK